MRRSIRCVMIYILQRVEEDTYGYNKKITALREKTGENRKEFPIHIGIPIRTLEYWEAAGVSPPEYIQRLKKMRTTVFL